jgi:hypothetical protein
MEVQFGSAISIKFPNARIIYWETTKKTPDEVTLTLSFPDGEYYHYECGEWENERRIENEQ